MARSLFRASVLVSLALLISRFSGLVREQVLGAHLGLSADMDGALLILTLPDLMVGLLLSGGFSAALVPALTRADPTDRVALVRRMMAFTGLGAVVLGLLLFAATPLVLAALAPSLEMAELTAFQVGFALSLATIPISAVIGVSSSYLQVKGSYSIPALMVLAFNLPLIAYFSIGLNDPRVNFALFGLAVACAAFLRFALQTAWMREVFRPPAGTASSALFGAGFSRTFMNGILAAALIVGMPLVFRSIYALGGDGELARFNYALRLFELPMGVLIGPILVIFLPLLSHLHGADQSAFKSRAALGLRATYLLGLAAALTVVVFARPITTLIFGFGEMRGESTDAIATTARMIIIGLPFMAAFQILSTTLNASARTGQALLLSCIAFAAAVAVALGLHLAGATPALAAEIGFIAFGIFACAIGFRCVFDGPEAAPLLIGLGGITLRSALVVLPFLLLSSRDPAIDPRLLDLVLVVALPLGILAANLPVLRELSRVRDSRNDKV